MPRPFLASSVGTKAGTDLAAARPGEGGLPALQRRKTPGSHTLAQTIPSSRIPFFPLPALKRLLSLQSPDETSPFWLGPSCARKFN